jgi:hypothetical protein
VHWAYHHGLVESEGTAARLAAMLESPSNPRPER